MPLERNKAIARVWFDEVMNGRDPTAIYRTYAEDYRYRGPGASVDGREGAREIAEHLIAAMPDRVSTVIDQVAEGDTVATRWSSRGTPVLPVMGHEPDGTPVVVHGITISTIRDGLIVEDWELVEIGRSTADGD